MATSGTVATFSVNAAQLLDQAFLACGKQPSTVSGELLLRARERLQFALWALANDGVNLWAIKKTIFNLRANKSVIPMAAGTVDVINALWRTLNTSSGASSSGAGFQGFTFDAETVVKNVSGTFSLAGTVNLTLEASVDGANWTSLNDLNPVAVDASSSFAIDVDNSLSARWWRIRDRSGSLIPITGLQFRTIASEIECSKLNRDDYQQLPTKAATGDQPLQFWYDKQINPQLWIWPIPNRDTDQLIVWEHSLIQDVGALTNQIAVPLRWYEAVCSIIAHRIALIIPPSELPEGRLATLENLAINDKRRAANGESDGSATRMAPNLRGYTR